MLSYEDIGSAAMLSRATAGVASGCVIFYVARLRKRRCVLRLETHRTQNSARIVRELTK